MDINHKLDLIQKLRKEQAVREQECYRNYCRENRQVQPTLYDVNKGKINSFRLRFLLAILLFLCFFLLEQRNIKIWEIDADKIADYIGENTVFDSEMFDKSIKLFDK